MDKRLLIISAAAAVTAIALIGALPGEPVERKKAVFHATLADPELYAGGTYNDVFYAGPGEYVFRFVPNGSSPRVLSVSLAGPSVDYSEDFELVGTLHQTGISEYHTWDYAGEKRITLPEAQEIAIVIDPNGETGGAVSVGILKR